MDKHLEYLIYFINNPSFVVFWVTNSPTSLGEVRYKITSVKEHDDEMKAYIDNGQGYVDLFNFNYNDFEVMMEVDWKIF